MSEVNIKFRKNASRGNTTPGECINLRSPLDPDGVAGGKFGTNAQGGDGLLEFNIGDRGPEGNWPGMKNDAAEVYYGVERVTQHSIMQARRNEMAGELEYGCQGHEPHYEKALGIMWDSGAPTDRTVLDWVKLIWHDATYGFTGSTPNLPFFNASERYIESMLAAENPTVHIGFDASTNAETIFAELLKFCDFERGVFPGRDKDSDSLGCYPYWRHRTRGKTVKWYIEKEDMAAIPGGGFRVDLDMSNYCNYVRVHYTDSGGVDTFTSVQNTVSQAQWTPGSQERFVVDLRQQQGYHTLAQAQQVGQVYLDIYSKPVPKGSIILPLKSIQRVGMGQQWSGMIRGGDIVKVERDEYRQFDESDPIDNFNAFLVDATLADIDAGQVELFMPEPADLENIIAGSMTA